MDTDDQQPTAPIPDDYRLQHRELAGELDDSARAWLRAVRRGFNEAHASEENMQRWWATAVADGQRWHWAHRTGTAPGLGLDELPAATLGTVIRRVNVGGGRFLESDYILDVTVRPADAGRGLMRALMVDELHRAHQQGLALASLTATEAGLYGRFGFGAATWRQRVEVATGPRFRLHAEPRLVVEEADALAVADHQARLHEEFVARHRSAHQPLAWRRDFHSGAWNWETMAPHQGMRALAALDGEQVVGVASFTVQERRLKVYDLVGDDRAELALWQRLARLPLVDTLTHGSLQAGSPLRAALADPRVVTVTGEGDQIWLRVLDVPAALTARDWERDGEVVLAVDDPLGLTDGCWRLVVRGGEASCTAADPSLAQLRMGVDVLGQAYFGALPLTVLAAAGRVQGDPGAVRRLQGMLAVAEPPRNLTVF